MTDPAVDTLAETLDATTLDPDTPIQVIDTEEAVRRVTGELLAAGMPVAVDFEGRDLCRAGKLDLMQVSNGTRTWLIDVTTLGEAAFSAGARELLESSQAQLAKVQREKEDAGAGALAEIRSREALSSELHDAQTQLAEMNALTKDLKAKVAAAEAELAEVKAEAKAAKAQLESAAAEATEAKAQLATATAGAKALVEELAGVTRKKEMHHDKAKEFYAEAKAAKEEVAALQAEVAALKAQPAAE